ncbi:MAG: ABC transporter ATP-binding protein [Lachnospiraceae bacterium]|nr:ABC transporter ATP-binding protein [Lachnospiraceae bacterium]MCR4937766.1 ABC transporter ATP-binding protein [Lachnospiraceae bacterium]
MITADHISFIYGSDHRAVDDLSFHIKKGEIAGFAGPNGAGKTTVIKMLTGVLKPASGKAVINGHDIVKEPLEAKRSFAYVADNPDVLLQLTGLEYINFISDIYKVPEDERKKRAMDMAERFGMQESLDTPMREYSHGMRQKLMIIAALTHNPPAWILDEPMTGLDPSSAYELKNLMKEHAAAGNSVLFSTHVLEVAEKLCDHIIIINHGRDLYQGTVEELEKKNEGMDLEQIFLNMTGYSRENGDI